MVDIRKCEYCGRFFETTSSGQKYCSGKCRNDPKASALRKFFTQFFADGFLEERNHEGEGILDNDD